jgi:hypothetical protein
MARAGEVGYVPIRTRDLSMGGCLAEVASSRTYAPGDEVQVVMAPRGEETVVLRSANVLRGRVVRVGRKTDGSADRVEVALRYTA